MQQQQCKLTEENKEGDLCVVTTEYNSEHCQQSAHQMKAKKKPQPRLIPVNLQRTQFTTQTHRTSMDMTTTWPPNEILRRKISTIYHASKMGIVHQTSYLYVTLKIIRQNKMIIIVIIIIIFFCKCKDYSDIVRENCCKSTVQKKIIVTFRIDALQCFDTTGINLTSCNLFFVSLSQHLCIVVFSAFEVMVWLNGNGIV